MRGIRMVFLLSLKRQCVPIKGKNSWRGSKKQLNLLVERKIARTLNVHGCRNEGLSTKKNEEKKEKKIFFGRK